MDPFTLAMAGIQAVAGGLGMAGQIMGGNAGARNARYTAMMHAGNAEIGKINAQIAQTNADMALVSSTFEGNRSAAETERVLGGQVASLSARGIDPTYGSPLVIQGLTAAQGASDVALAQAGGAVGYAAGLAQKDRVLAGVTDSLMSGYNALAKGRQQQQAAYLGAATTLLQTITKMPGLQGGGFGGGGGGGMTVKPATVNGSGFW